MHSGIHKYLNHKFPQNYIIRKPLPGVLIISSFCIVFLLLYKPLGFQPSRNFSYEFTMAFYSIFSGFAAMLTALLLRSIKWFSNKDDWTILKELISILLVIAGTGIAIYLIGFIMETSTKRWNINTFLDSFGNTFLIGIFPFAFFTLINYRYLFPNETGSFQNTGINGITNQTGIDRIQITSQLKKESLSFNPDDLIYAESDGNYVIFYLTRSNAAKKEIIRNSINNIEQQLSEIPYFLRTHRAFIVNLKKVISKQGTTLGYSLKLSGTETRVPVSRNNTKQFNSMFSVHGT